MALKSHCIGVKKKVMWSLQEKPKIGEKTIVYPFAVLGEIADWNLMVEKTSLTIGKRNQIRSL